MGMSKTVKNINVWKTNPSEVVTIDVVGCFKIFDVRLLRNISVAGSVFKFA